MDTNTLLVIGLVVFVLVLVGVLLFRRQTSSGSSKAPSLLGAALRGAWGSGLNHSTWDEIEEGLLAADVGVETSIRIVASLRTDRPETPDDAREALAVLLRKEFEDTNRTLNLGSAVSTVLIVGVNGTGKTTTIAKLSARLKSEGRTVLIAAADTFRAAAGEQLEVWAKRVGVDVVTGQEGGDPAAVVFDAISAATARHVDVVLIDTAGRLHGKKNLMGELSKIHRVASSEGEVDEVLLVLDATAGQNGLAQVREFVDTVPVSGIVLTKLDGTARGGIVIAVENELKVPVKFIGVGEGIDDMEPFDPDSFVSGLLEGS